MTLLSACRGNKEFSWNERLTVVVDTPQGPITASSVTELDYKYFDPQNMGGNNQSGKRYGEAVVMDLGEGRYFFALLSGTSSVGYRAFDDLADGSLNLGEYIQLISEQVGKPARSIPEKYRPMLVTFGAMTESGV